MNQAGLADGLDGLDGFNFPAQDQDFNLTPFRNVTSSAILRTDILQALLDHYPSRVLSSNEDFHEYRMMEYLWRNRVHKSADLLTLILEKDAHGKSGYVVCVEKWRVDMSERIKSADWIDDVENRQMVLERTIRRFLNSMDWSK